MKTIIEFGEEEQDDAILALRSGKFFAAMWFFGAELRKIWKYGDHGKEAQDIVDKIYGLWSDAFGDFDEG